MTAQLGYDIPPAPVIQELQLSAWVLCNRPGAQMAATVVLPRSVDPRTGKPRELLLRGGETAATGGWQEIKLADLPEHLADQARVARAQRDGDVDERGAYVSQLVIFAPGGPGTTEILVDPVSVSVADPSDCLAVAPKISLIEKISNNRPPAIWKSSRLIPRTLKM